MLNYLKQVFSHSEERIKSPFFGTLIFVWIVKNWKLPYAFFNFDKKITLEQKISYFKGYYREPYHPILDILECIVTAFILMIIGFFLNFISKLIAEAFEVNLTEWLDKIKSEKVIKLSEVNELKVLNKNLKTEVSNLNGETQFLKDENVSLKDRLGSVSLKLHGVEEDIRIIQKNYDDLKENFNDTKNYVSKVSFYDQKTCVNIISNQFKLNDYHNFLRILISEIEHNKLHSSVGEKINDYLTFAFNFNLIDMKEEYYSLSTNGKRVIEFLDTEYSSIG